MKKLLILIFVTLIHSFIYSQAQIFAEVFPNGSVQRGQHVLIFIEDDISDVTITLANTREPDITVGRIERMTKIGVGTYIILIPYDIPNGDYVLAIEETIISAQNSDSLFTVSGDLEEVECVSEFEEHNVLPACVKYFKDAEHPNDLKVENIDFEVLDGDNLGFWIPIDIDLIPGLNPDTQSLVFVGGIQVPVVSESSSKFTFRFRPMNIQNFNYSEHQFSGGYNEVFVLQWQATEERYQVYTSRINVVGVPYPTVFSPNLDTNEFVITFWPSLSEGEFFNVWANVQANLPIHLNNIFEIEFSQLSTTSRDDLCGGSIAVLRMIEAGQEYGNVLRILHSIFTDELEIVLGPIAESRSGSLPQIIIDPQPLPSTCEADPFYFSETGIRDARENNTFNPLRAFGKDMTIAVIDTGVSSSSLLVQQELGSRLLSSQGIDYFQQDIQSWGQYNDFLHIKDFNNDGINDVPFGVKGHEPINIGHGTGIALLAAGNTLGSANEASVLPIRACDHNGFCRGSNVVRGICYALDNVESDNLVINLSLGSSTPMKALERVIIGATEDGATVVAAAGNFGDPEEDNKEDELENGTAIECKASSNICSAIHDVNVPRLERGPAGKDRAEIQERFFTDSQLHYPAAYSHIEGLIAVGAIERKIETSGLVFPRGFSNRGAYVDVVAPDYNLLFNNDLNRVADLTNHRFSSIYGNGLSNQQMDVIPNDFYKGTSFSTGMVSGIAAVVKQMVLDSGISDRNVETCVKATASVQNPQDLRFSQSFAVHAGSVDLNKAIIECLTVP